MIDPAVFTDDDGRSYLYWGNGHGYVVPLNADMMSFDASKVRDITQPDFREGSFVVKRQGTYYFMWSEDDTRSENYHVAYATGPSPLGPWTKRGTILSKRPEYGIKGTGHHSVVNVPGTDDWYIVYHRFALNGPGKAGGDGTHRGDHHRPHGVRGRRNDRTGGADPGIDPPRADRPLLRGLSP